MQLGDLGAYAARPGSAACFSFAERYLAGFAPLPYSLVTGNHDLEGFDDFSSDSENLAAWRAVFGQHHYWALRAGGHLLIGLSTVRFRDAPGSCHEVFVDAQQAAWFAATLAANREVPTFVFTHAPPMGCGLRALPAVHVKNRCAWLNHGEAAVGPTRPTQFVELAAQNPQLKLWFSGHFHLSHDYADSLSVCGECTFVQVGVMGGLATRDGRRHSRLLRAHADGYKLYTVDHNAGGALRLDLSRSYAAGGPPVREPLPGMGPPLCREPLDALLFAQDACELGAPPSGGVTWLDTGDSELAIQEGMVIEYDSRTRAPVGVVLRNVAPGRRLRLVGGDGRAAEGFAAVALEVVAEDGVTVEERVPRGPSGMFAQIFQENKYKKWLKMAATSGSRGTSGGAARV